MEGFDECLHELVAYNGSLQIAHWRADTITNEHKTLGDLYDTMIGLTDSLAETFMGKYGVIDFVSDIVIEDISEKPVAKGLEIIDDLYSYMTDKDDDLLNIIADMEIALNKAKYLLKE